VFDLYMVPTGCLRCADGAQQIGLRHSGLSTRTRLGDEVLGGRIHALILAKSGVIRNRGGQGPVDEAHETKRAGLAL
jgi:hypothetical protein